jgi:trehalose synthase-fused probable maltokinase
VVRADLVVHAAGLLDPGWLTAQRWYGANDRRLRTLALADAAPLPTEGAPAWLLIVEATFEEGATNRYLVPAVADAPGGRLHEPRDGDGTWRALAAALIEHGVLDGEAGSFRGEPSPAVPALLPGGVDELAELAERRLGVQQTNTSVAIGDRLILKLYRRLQAGENPELEVGTFLESVGSRVVPRMAGSMRYVATESAAAALLQERLETMGDAWAQVVAMLSGADGGPEAGLQAASLIGSVTARLHGDLAARPHDLLFPVRMADPAERREWLANAKRQADRAEQAVTGSDAIRLAELMPGIRARMDSSLAAVVEARVTRIHGDYHLGQLLCIADGYAVIDFEGEPARPLAERRAPAPPERDVAGMLRSLDYAARTVERGREHGDGDGFDADGWLALARDAFLRAYAAEAPAPPNEHLLEAFELEKACYEVSYEAANRPDWTWLPLEALARLL